MVIAIPTGIKIWASVRMYGKLLLLSYITNIRVRSNEDHSTYLDAVTLEEQQPVLKRAMRETVAILSMIDNPNIGLTIIGLMWMKLNC